jgi:hypothetical protein
MGRWGVRARIVVGALLSFGASSILLAAEPPALAPLAFLVGEWPATGEGRPGSASGTAVFARGLQDRVIVRTSFAESPATAGRPASRHDDLMVIYAAPDGGARADYYDNESHVIRYAVQSPGPGRAVFLSEAAAGQPRFRLTYALQASGLLEGEFAIAAPGQDFASYLRWESRRASGR